jgi:uncharacterized protein
MREKTVDWVQRIIEKYYDTGTGVYQVLMDHSRRVADKALAIAGGHPEMNFDLGFVEEAAMLHDIGIRYCDAPEIGCFGEYDYVCHGFLGAEILRKEGLPRHALVCERHTGTGISLKEIVENQLPLPHRDFVPVSIEEQLICFADKFFSKSDPANEKRIFEIEKSLQKHGKDGVLCFNQWCKRFLG